MTRGEAVNWLINIMADIGKAEHSDLWHYEQALSEIRELLEAQPYFDITVKIDKAYDDGYEAGYLQGRHDWGDLDE